MEDLVLKSESLLNEIERDLEMPRIKRNLSQIIYAGNQMWNRTVGQSANRDASEVRASVLLGISGYDYPKVSRNLDNLVSRAVKHYGALTNQATQPVLRGTDIKGFVRYERENAIIKIIEETKTFVKDQVEKSYWDTVQESWKRDRLDLLNLISSVDLANKDIFASDAKSFNRMTNLSKPDATTSINLSQTMGDEDILKIASDREAAGQFEEAVELYDSISKYDKVLKILIMLLSEVMSGIKTDITEKTRIENLAFRIANKYCEPQIDLPQTTAGTFYLLLDLMTFFNYYRSNLYSEALDTIYKLKILPATQKEVEVKSRQFNRYPVEIRLNIPDILMATMNMLYASYKEQPSLEVKEKAKALMTFSGMIQYRLPSDAIARMLELEVLIN
uniref:Nuclear pore protein n=1 Tax=Aceria tosichella TaxID=561515 RepID=A0A6G1SHQ6_9ACAR